MNNTAVGGRAEGLTLAQSKKELRTGFAISDAVPFVKAGVLKVKAARVGEGGGGGGVVLIFMDGRSCMTIGPRILTMPGRSLSGFHRPGRHCLHQARSAGRVLGESHEG